MTCKDQRQVHNRNAVLWVIFCAALLLCALLAMPTKTDKNDALLRFHVVASSDSAADQADKVAVAEALQAVLLPLLEAARDSEELCLAVRESKDTLQRTAEATLAQRGRDTTVQISVKEALHKRTEEGVISLKEGAYPTLRVTLGEGQGHNCFSVLFPSLSLWVASDGTALSPTLQKRGRGGQIKFRTYEVLASLFEGK